MLGVTRVGLSVLKGWKHFLGAIAFSTVVACDRPAQTQTWESLNPGGGGQIQDVVLNPTQPDKGFVLSDVDGLYYTEDGGEEWHYALEGLAGTNTLALAYDPKNAKRVYLGTTVGLHVSDDGGRSWDFQEDTRRGANPGLLTKTDGTQELAVGSVVVNARDTRQVLAGVGNKRDSFIRQAAVFRSVDGGKSFSPVRFGPESDSDKSILQLAYDESRQNVYAATAEGGLWRGADFGADGQWVQLASPSGMTDRVEGVGVAPDGTVYAAFGVQGGEGTEIFASRDRGQSWQALAGEGRPTDKAYSFRNLIVDPRSEKGRQSLLTAADNNRTGLYELTVEWAGDVPTATWEQVFWYEQRDSAGFESGWEGGIYGNHPRPTAYQYTPEGWGERGIWTSGDQTLFKVSQAGGVAEWENGWQPLYTEPAAKIFENVPVDVAFTASLVEEVPEVETYRSRGWQSTVDMDVSRYGDVIMRSGADHGVTMSWDGGQSWEDVSSPRRAKSQANAIVTKGEDVFLLAHFSGPFDFGASNTEGELWGAQIDPANPQPVQWHFLAGGTGKYGEARGLASDVYTNIVADESVPGRVYVSSRGQGIYAIPDIAYLYNARVNGLELDFYPRIEGSPSANEYEGSMVLDPNDNRVLYVADGNTLYKGVRDEGSSDRLQDMRWEWTPILSSDRRLTFDAWDRDGTTVVAAAVEREGAYQVEYSTDAGRQWGLLLTVDDLTAVRTPIFDFSEVEPKIFAVEGRGDSVYLSAQTSAPTNLGYGVFEASLSGRGGGEVKDITGDLAFPNSFRSKILTDPVTGETHLYMASWGSGTWRLLID